MCYHNGADVPYTAREMQRGRRGIHSLFALGPSPFLTRRTSWLIIPHDENGKAKVKAKAKAGADQDYGPGTKDEMTKDQVTASIHTYA